MKFILAPDVYVNASVALGSDPDLVVQRVFQIGTPPHCSEWILARVEAMLQNHPHFVKETIPTHIERIRSLVTLIDHQDAPPDAWSAALATAAKKVGAQRIITDHPDLLDQGQSDGVEFVATTAWLLEQALPPPPPQKN